MIMLYFIKRCEASTNASSSGFPSSPNIALYKDAYQSATHTYPSCGPLKASLAVDGDKNPDVSMCHCSHTTFLYSYLSTWVSVDLIEPYNIDYVTVYSGLTGK